MMTVHEVSKLTGVSIRTLQYYDQIGLLPPSARTESGYRLYDNTALETLQQILLFRELEFSLKDIGKILCRNDFNKNLALEQQIALLTMKRDRLNQLIEAARQLKSTGGNTMDFSIFDTSKIDEYSARAKAQWGHTDAYKEYEKKSENRDPQTEKANISAFMQLFAEFGQIKELSPDSEKAQTQVKKLQDSISANFYHCTDAILSSLGEMYISDNEFTQNIDRAGGLGTAAFTADAIRIYCGSKKH